MTAPLIRGIMLTPGTTVAGGNQTGTPALVFTPEDGRAEPTYYIHPVGQIDVDGVRRTMPLVMRGSDYLRVAPHPDRGNNPNVFIRRDDPHAAMAEVVPMSPLPEVGHVIVRDNLFYPIVSLVEGLDAVLVEAVASDPDAVPSRITLKADDLAPGGSPVPGLTLWK